MSALAGKRILVFGASSGPGAVLSRILIGEGASVVAVSRSAEKLAALEESIASDRLKTVPLDGTDEAAIAEFATVTGQLDHLVLCAGGGGLTGPFVGIPLADARKSFEGKFWLQVGFAHSFLSNLGGKGSLTFVTGAAANRAVQGTAWVAAVNGAIHAMLGPLALDLAPIRVNAVSPGTFDSGHWHRLPPEKKDELFSSVAAKLPAGRVGQPEDIAEALRYLLTAEYVTGQMLVVDGGLMHSGAPDRSNIKKN